MCVSACTRVSVCHRLPVRVWLSFISVLWSERALLLRLVSDQLTPRVKPWKFAKCFLKRGIQRRLAKLRHERVAVKRGWLECKTQVMVITLSPCRFRLWGPNICVCVCVCVCVCNCFGSLSALSSTLFPAAAGSCFAERKLLKKTLH